MRGRNIHACMKLSPHREAVHERTKEERKRKSIFRTATAAQKDVSVRKQARNSIRGPQVPDHSRLAVEPAFVAALAQ